MVADVHSRALHDSLNYTLPIHYDGGVSHMVGCHHYDDNIIYNTLKFTSSSDALHHGTL